MAAKCLLVTGTRPGQAGVGEIIVRDLCSRLGDESIVCAWIAPRRSDSNTHKDRDGVRVVRFERRFETGFRPVPGAVGDLVSHVAWRCMFEPHAYRIARRLLAQSLEWNPDRIWVVLDCPTTICLADAWLRQSSTPVHVLVWDTPELLATQLGYGRPTSLRLLKIFSRVMKGAKRCAVVGESMKERYDRQFQQDCVVVRHGLADSVIHPVRETRSQRDTFVIGFAGSLTAPDAFATLIQSLDRNQWRMEGREVVLRLVGLRYLLDSRCPQRLEYFGWRTVEETVRLLADSDVLYLPQPFSVGLKELASMSFPTKLSTYLAAGRPILLHAPEYSSVVPFFRRFPFGSWCQNTNPDVLFAELARLISEPEVYRQAARAGRAALQDELNAAVFFARFQTFLELASADGAMSTWVRPQGPELPSVHN